MSELLTTRIRTHAAKLGLTIDPDEVDREAVTSGRALHLDGHNVAASMRAASRDLRAAI